LWNFQLSTYIYATKHGTKLKQNKTDPTILISHHPIHCMYTIINASNTFNLSELKHHLYVSQSEGGSFLNVVIVTYVSAQYVTEMGQLSPHMPPHVFSLVPPTKHSDGIKQSLLSLLEEQE
jgi:hypothetical protein